MDTQLDPQVVNLAKAIRQTESGGNFEAKGKSGEYGAYQFTEPTWNTWSKKFGIDKPLSQATKEDQNQVAYKQIKEWKDQGLNVGQVASMWNSGKPDAYLDNGYKGTNKYGAKFDVPAYAKSVASAYQTIKNGGQADIDPNNPSSVQPPAGQPDSQGYITSADIPNTPASQPDQNQSNLSKASSDLSQGNYGKAAQEAVGMNPNDSLYGKIIDNSFTRGIQGFFPGAKVGQAIGTLGGYVASGFDKNYDTSAPDPTDVAVDVAKGALMIGGLKGTGALTEGLISKFGPLAKSLANPTVEEALGGSKIAAQLTNAEKYDELVNALENSTPSQRMAIQKAIDLLKPLAEKEMGMAPSLLNRVTGGVGKLAWKGAKKLGSVALGAAGLGGAEALYRKYIK